MFPPKGCMFSDCWPVLLHLCWVQPGIHLRGHANVVHGLKVSGTKKTNHLPGWFGEGMKMSKPTHPVLGNYDFLSKLFQRQRLFYSYRRFFVFSKKGVEHSNVEHQEPKLCNNSAPRSKQSFSSAWAQKSNYHTQPPAEIEIFSDLIVPNKHVHTPFYESKHLYEMSKSNSAVCGLNGNWLKPWFWARRTVQEILSSFSPFQMLIDDFNFYFSEHPFLPWLPGLQKLDSKKSPLYITSTSKVRGESP